MHESGRLSEPGPRKAGLRSGSAFTPLKTCRCAPVAKSTAFKSPMTSDPQHGTNTLGNVVGFFMDRLAAFKSQQSCHVKITAKALVQARAAGATKQGYMSLTPSAKRKTRSVGSSNSTSTKTYPVSRRRAREVDLAVVTAASVPDGTAHGLRFVNGQRVHAFGSRSFLGSGEV